MPVVSFRMQLSALAWIAMGLTIGFTSGCQQWSLRKNMNAFFGGEPKDDWEPPVKSAAEEADQETQAANEEKSSWWSRRKPNSVQRVVLPRDRMAATSQKQSDSMSTPPKLPVAELTPQTRSILPARVTGLTPSSSPTGSSSDTQISKPKGELVAFGANPAGWPGEVMTPPRDRAGAMNSQAGLIDTGVQDADLEASLQSLPPQFREVVQRTLQAVKEGTPIDKLETAVPADPNSKSSPAPTTSATVAPVATTAPTATTVPATNTVPAVPPPAIAADTSRPVSVRFSEGTIKSIPTPEPSSISPAPIGSGSTGEVASPSFVNGSSSSNSNAVTSAVASFVPSTSGVLPPVAVDPNAMNSSGSLPSSHSASSSHVTLAVADSKNPGKVVATSANASVLPSPTLDPATKSSTWHGMISEAIERLESDLESKPTADESLRRSQEITLRMLYVAQRRLDDALRPIERMDSHEQEYVRHQMQALYEASNPDANPARPRHWSSVMMSQREATAHLAAVSNLEVRSVAFCTQVDGYGMFQKFAKNHFAPDQDVLLYCEIDNVAADKVKSGFETQLQGSYEIRDNQGRLVADQDLPMEPENCMNHRRDYFMVYRIYMPSQLPSGNYELRLTIHDKKGGKYGHSSASFEIRQ